MAESTSNVEYAHRIHEQGHEQEHGPSGRHHEWLALAEAIVLAIVAVSTAWSGYQAAKWDALSAKQYALNSTTMILSQEKASASGQYRLFDVLTFNGWMYANATGNEKLKELYARRFRPELRVAFNDWLKLDPMHNPDAPPGPGLMPSFKDPLAEEATRLAHQAQTYFEEAAESRETGDQYVKVTVLLATVLLLTALSQRFKPLGPRVIVIAIAFILLISSMTLLVRLPRA